MNESLVRAVEALERATVRLEEATRRLAQVTDVMLEDHQEHIDLREAVSAVRVTLETIPCRANAPL